MKEYIFSRAIRYLIRFGLSAVHVLYLFVLMQDAVLTLGNVGILVE
jgi:hypothetical protein